MAAHPHILVFVGGHDSYYCMRQPPSEWSSLLLCGDSPAPDFSLRKYKAAGLLDMETNKFNPYRDRLIKRGVVSGDTYGYVSFTLPLFERYVIEHS